VAPWWWFPRKPKHAGAVFLILKCFNNSTFFNVVCISWKLKCWVLLMHSVTVKKNAYLKHVEDEYWNKLREGKKCIFLVLIMQVLSKRKSFIPADYNIDNTSSYKSLITPGTCNFICVKQVAGWQASSMLSVSTVCTFLF